MHDHSTPNPGGVTGANVEARPSLSLAQKLLGDDPLVRDFERWFSGTSEEHQKEVFADLSRQTNDQGDFLFQHLMLVTVIDFPERMLKEAVREVLERWSDELERRIDGYVYVLECKGTGACKIGRSRDPVGRRRQLGIQLPYPTELVHVVASENCASTEKEIHEVLADVRLNGEWFRLGDAELAGLKDLVVHRYPSPYPLEDLIERSGHE